MKILFFGSSDFSVPFLDGIYCSKKHTVSLAVTGTDKKKGRGRKLLPSPVKKYANSADIDSYELENFSEVFYKRIKNLDFDCIVSVSFGKIIPGRLLEMAEDRTVNIHPSILPRYRGPSPIISTLLNGDKITGISFIKISNEIDAGDIYMQTEFAVAEEDNKDTLEKKMSVIGTGTLIMLLDMIEKNEMVAYSQSAEDVSYTRLFTKKDLYIDWKLPAEQIVNKIRAFGLTPGCITMYKKKTIKILKAKFVSILPGSLNGTFSPGQILRADKDGLIVLCGNSLKSKDKSELNNSLSCVKVELLKPQDKNSMDYVDFLNGYRIKPGDFLG